MKGPAHRWCVATLGSDIADELTGINGWFLCKPRLTAVVSRPGSAEARAAIYFRKHITSMLHVRRIDSRQADSLIAKNELFYRLE